MICHCARVALAGVFVSAIFPGIASADDCKLGRVASLDMNESGVIVVPVSIEGSPQHMVIDTGSPLTVVDPQAASDLHLITHRIVQGMMYNAKGEQFTQLAIIHALGIGEMHADDVRVLVWPSRMSSDNSIAGTLGADLLRHYDVDLDFGAHKLNLFLQDHCPGKVVYWTSDNVAVVPIHVVNSGHIIVPVAVDGHEFDAVLDTGASRTILSMESARNTFGLAPNSPEMAKVGDVRGAVETDTYRHTFKTLVFGGITIANPTFYMWDNLMKYSMTQATHTGSRLSDSNESGGVTDLTLGISELRHLHLYIAYKEQKLYITPASAPAAAATASPASVAARPKDTAALHQ